MFRVFARSRNGFRRSGSARIYADSGIALPRPIASYRSCAMRFKAARLSTVEIEHART